ncbi:unnamed protein product [Rhizoctonia solani]|uniref:F-box domain-containing protein n=1 Tax=Rhizoctonia solani TaxID=456999 RepID=A0A8H2WIT2_9AGAM|nr:unnamed protein product [Rhizoctonia solani]
MVNLPDLPTEIILQILSYLGPPMADPFWWRGITPQTLLPFSLTLDNKSRAEQVEHAKRLGLVCKKLWPVCTSIVWMRRECNPILGLKNLLNVCRYNGGPIGYIQELTIQLPYIPLDELEYQLEIIWPNLTSLHTLTLTLTTTYGCPSWLATQLQSIPGLHTLCLRVMGDSIGPHLRDLLNIRNLYIEVYPPDMEDHETDPLGPGPASGPTIRDNVSREVYHSWSSLFNDLAAFIGSCGNVARLSWHVHWTMVHAFYRHTICEGSAPNKFGQSIKCISVFPRFITSLSISLESQLGTEPFVRALGGLPITDLALVLYDHALLLGTEFENLCVAFRELRRLKLKLRTPSITVGGGTPGQFSVDIGPIVRGLSSLPYLKSYRGPLVVKRPPPVPSVASSKLIRLEAKATIAKLARQLAVKGVSPNALFQWCIWVDGKYGPKEFETVPQEGPKRLDQFDEGVPTETEPYSLKLLQGSLGI